MRKISKILVSSLFLIALKHPEPLEWIMIGLISGLWLNKGVDLVADIKTPIVFLLYLFFIALAVLSISVATLTLFKTKRFDKLLYLNKNQIKEIYNRTMPSHKRGVSDYRVQHFLIYKAARINEDDSAKNALQRLPDIDYAREGLKLVLLSLLVLFSLGLYYVIHTL